jgi:hypothetical protein
MGKRCFLTIVSLLSHGPDLYPEFVIDSVFDTRRHLFLFLGIRELVCQGLETLRHFSLNLPPVPWPADLRLVSEVITLHEASVSTTDL